MDFNHKTEHQMTNNDIYNPENGNPVWLTHMTKSQVATLCGVHLDTVYTLTTQGLIPEPKKIGREAFYPIKGVMAYVSQKEKSLKRQHDELKKRMGVPTLFSDKTKNAVRKAHDWRCDECGNRHRDTYASGRPIYLEPVYPDYLTALNEADDLPFGWAESIDFKADVKCLCSSCKPYTSKLAEAVSEAMDVRSEPSEPAAETQDEAAPVAVEPVPTFVEQPKGTDDEFSQLIERHLAEPTPLKSMVEVIREREAKPEMSIREKARLKYQTKE